MERSSRFLWELKCGRKEQQLFQQALTRLSGVVEQTENLTLLSDGERRYGNVLFAICHEVVRAGRPGRPKKRLPKGVRVRLKNKGSKKRQGRPRKKYQAPVAEHPDSEYAVENHEIHANHVEAFNASLSATQRCLSAQNQHLCQNPRPFAKNSGCVLARPQRLFGFISPQKLCLR